MMRVTHIVIVVGTIWSIASTGSAQEQMGDGNAMKGGMKGGPGMMNCPMMGEDMGLMQDPDVKMNVTNTADGIIVKWTSTSPDEVAALKKMGRTMASMHAEAPAKVTKPK